MMKFLTVLCVCEVAFAAMLDFSRPEHKCGVVASSNPIHQNPWLVHLEFYRRGLMLDIRCGATLIGKRHILTAAHCVKNSMSKKSRIIARLGEFDLSKKEDCFDGVCAHLPVKLKVDKVILHPEYDGKEHDLAILVLARDIPYTETIRPVCLPTGKIHTDAVFSATGWGETANQGVYSDIKKHLLLPYWSPSRCRAAYHHLNLPKHIICAGGERGVDTCRGDSGGPLVWDKGYTKELWGVTSSGNVRCGTKGSPGIYTSVFEHSEWINEMMQQKM